MDRAYARIKENDAEAARLLNSINNYVLTQLGIQFPEVKQEKVLVVNVEDIKGQRFDVEYNQFKSFENQLSIKNSIKIIEFIIDYKKGIEVGSNQYVNNGTIPFVRISDINENSLNLQQTKKKISDSLFKQLKQNFSPKKGEILYTKDGTIGLSYLVTTQKNYIVSSSFLRLICENIQLAKFLKIILSLKVYKEMANKKSSGTIIKHLNLKEFLNISIPFPSYTQIEKIVIEVDEIQAKVKSLKKDTAGILQKAQQEVEEIIFQQ
uniref:Type I restriction modification DNA specificity domain-containing protein n=1 Tax=Flabellia petiolata TaxID=189428 RepID=A0A386AX51_9CHLO|nr:hypothetical protein [Flabellia petiolata]